MGRMAARRSQRYLRGLGHFSLESHLLARSRMVVNVLLGDEQGVVVLGLRWDVEQHPGLAFAHAGKGASAYALLSRDKPQLVVAVRPGLLEVIELELDLLVARGLRADLGHTPVSIEPGGLFRGWDKLNGRHRGLLSQKSEEGPEGDDYNGGRCCHAG